MRMNPLTCIISLLSRCSQHVSQTPQNIRKMTVINMTMYRTDQNNNNKKVIDKNVLTFADRWFSDLPVFQLVVDANHQHLVQRNQTGGWTCSLACIVPLGNLGSGGSPQVSSSPDPLQKVFQP